MKRAHLISRHVDGALLIELFTHHGIGTMVVPESPEVIRDATAADVPGIVQIIEPLEQQGILVRRERDKLEGEIEQLLRDRERGEHPGLRGALSLSRRSRPRSSPAWR